MKILIRWQKAKNKPNSVTSLSHINEIHLQVLRAVESRPGLTQRELAKELGVSLGKAHYCMKALIDKGLVKMGNFSHNQKKMDYAYLLTPSGIKSKATLTAHFLECKAAEYAMLKSELAKHEQDVKHVEQSNKIRIAEESAQ
jgi:EPS-associated MarR family transcriptional regulator